MPIAIVFWLKKFSIKFLVILKFQTQINALVVVTNR